MGWQEVSVYQLNKGPGALGRVSLVTFALLCHHVLVSRGAVLLVLVV